MSAKQTRANLRAAAARPAEAPARPAVGTTAQKTSTNTTVPLDFALWADIKGWCARRKAETGVTHDIGPVGALLYELLVSDDAETAYLREDLNARITERLT